MMLRTSNQVNMTNADVHVTCISFGVQADQLVQTVLFHGFHLADDFVLHHFLLIVVMDPMIHDVQLQMFTYIVIAMVVDI